MRFRRGDIWMADLGSPRGSEPAFLRPVLVIQDNHYNDSRIATVIVLTLTSNTAMVRYPGNVLVTAVESGLDRDSVINVTQVVTADKADLTQKVGDVPELTMEQVEYGLGLVLGLS